MKDFDLNNNKINSGFKVPENYFDNFENKILSKIEINKKSKVVPLFYKKQLWISSLAAVILLTIAIPVYFNSINNSAIENTTIENYLSYQSNFTTFDIIENLDETDIKALESSFAVNEEAIESYLIDNQNLDYYLTE